MFNKIKIKKTLLPTGGIVLATAVYNIDDEIIKPTGWEKIKTLKITKQSNFHPPQNPIILCHGLSGFNSIQIIPSFDQIKRILLKTAQVATVDQSPFEAIISIDYWHGIKKKLEQNGCKVFIAKVAPYGSISQRANLLNAFINQICVENDFQNINLVAHSMGGLDCRYLISAISDEQKTYKVLSLTTLSTPHHGSAVANLLVNELKLGKVIAEDGTSKLVPPAFGQLTTQYLEEFNQKYKKDENVAYFSYGAYFWPKWYNFFFITWKIIFNSTHVLEDRMNDGMVSINSSKYGEFLGVLGNVDHLTLINWLDLNKKFKLASWFSEGDVLKSKGSKDISVKDLTDDFDILDFYVTICDNIGVRGF
ncbi:hypothetical protein QEN19_002905 [Hanseniaspora menglaensis]